jgi:hypothetical protein
MQMATTLVESTTFSNVIAASPSPPSNLTTPPFMLTAVALGHAKWDTKYIHSAGTLLPSHATKLHLLLLQTVYQTFPYNH